MKHVAYGTLTLDVSKLIESVDEKEAVQRLIEKFNAYGISSINIQVELENGEVHRLEVNNHDMEWQHVEKIEEKEKVTKHTA